MEEFYVVGAAVILPLALIAAGVAIILMGMYQRTKSLEMAHRERMAMIERGLMPSPESDPARFEAATRAPSAGVPRFTSLGVAVVGIGLGLMLIISLAGGAPDVGIGVGGAIVVLGAAFIVNGYLQRGAHPPDVRPLPRSPAAGTSASSEPPGPPGPAGPPGAVGP